MQSILEQIDIANQLRQDELEKQRSEQESILVQAKSYERRL